MTENTHILHVEFVIPPYNDLFRFTWFVSTFHSFVLIKFLNAYGFFIKCRWTGLFCFEDDDAFVVAHLFVEAAVVTDDEPNPRRSFFCFGERQHTSASGAEQHCPCYRERDDTNV